MATNAGMNSELAVAAPERPEAVVVSVSGIGDYWTLLKPRVMSLVVFTAFAGLYLAPGSLHPVLAVTAILCIAAAAGAAAAVNNWYDSDIDPLMARTCGRPTATGRIPPAEALAFGVTTATLSVMVMGLALNWTAAALLALTIAFYLVVYTIVLKRRTPQNIVIGGAAGAFPPMVGWAAVTGDVGLGSIALFVLIFMWTPPHFWALSLYRCEDYARVGVPMLPVVAGPERTRQHILGYTLVLVTVSLLPSLLGGAGGLYLAAAVLLGVGFLRRAVALWRERSERAARRTFGFSILYLFALFGALIADKALGFGAW
jgi:protoheme IX farnesyltransferase